MDGVGGRTIAATASLEIGSLADGAHTVDLLDVASNCEVQGTRPRTVETGSGRTAEVSFDVECGPSTGAVRVITRTTGPDQDVDGYVVLVNGKARPMDLNGSVTFDDEPAGTAVAEILGVAPNCSAATETYYSVTVIGGGTVDVTFAFDCTPRQPDTGTLQVATATSGPSQDPDGYAVSIDGVVANQIATSASILLTGLPTGAHAVSISGIAANCAVSGDNPRSVTMSGTEIAVVAFAVVCTQPPASTGNLRLTTTTSGPDTDPTGYRLEVDGSSGQPIGPNATLTIGNLAAGSHSVRLGDVALNCTAAENPRTVVVPANGEASVTFAVSCIPAFGFITTTAVTNGGSVDPDGYVARVNGGAGKPIALNGSVTRGGLPPGPHTVQLDNVAPNCQVQGENPRAVIVAANDTTGVIFEVICAATTGSVTIAIAGLPTGTPAQVTVTGPGNYVASVSATATLGSLAPGQYTITAGDVAVGSDTYRPSSLQQTVAITAGGSPTVTVSYNRNAGGTFNLRIAGMYLTQAIQRPNGSVPLIAGRDGYLRVFVVASGDNSARPRVRVRVYQNGTQISTLQADAPTGSTPTVAQESPLSMSWNVRIPGVLIQRGLALLADVDPDGQVPETDESDNAFPSDAAPGAMEVRAASVFAVRFMPVQMGPGGLTGDVSPSSIGRFLDETLRKFPLPGVDADFRAVFTSSSSPAQAGGTNAALYIALSELRVLQVVEGGNRSYYGVFHNSYSSGGIAGLGYIGVPAAIGYDHRTDAGVTASHEFGHNWGRSHAPCGNPGGPDPNYPYVSGRIGMFGLDLANESLVEPTLPDLMGYCRPGWISDYTYTGVMAFRERFQPALMALPSTRQPAQSSLVIWGRIENGRPVLEPAFLVHTTPSLPSKTGPYRLEGVGTRGGRLFSIAFEASDVADSREGAQHFAFAIPISQVAASELSTIRLDGPTGAAEALAVAPTQARLALPPQARRIGGRVEFRWDPASAPMAMVRDASTGEVLAFARNGKVDVPTWTDNLEVHLSNGISSSRLMLPVAR